MYYKKIRVAELSQTGGSPIMKYIPYLVVENKSTKEVSFKGKADIVINIGGVQRTLKTDLPTTLPNERKEREIKGDLPIVNFQSAVYFIKLLNMPEVTFR
ncbi:MAG: hypothetical protein IPO21_04760 [Bacteroidales bacterium]|nr:hypothetical protein [Bacteroidales bacterium]